MLLFLTALGWYVAGVLTTVAVVLLSSWLDARKIARRRKARVERATELERPRAAA